MLRKSVPLWACAVVALLTLPISAFLWVTAPEFIPLVLGPKWGGVVAPFRLFSISLLFRMSSRISETCVSAAGRVYSQAVFTGAYAAMVIVGAIIGQRWGVGGVAICVSFAMLFNWLSMAWLARSITALPDSRFARAHAPGAALAGARLLPDVFLGQHGRWALKQVEQIVRRVRARPVSPSPDALAVGKANLK